MAPTFVAFLWHRHLWHCCSTDIGGIVVAPTFVALLRHRHLWHCCGTDICGNQLKLLISSGNGSLSIIASASTTPAEQLVSQLISSTINHLGHHKASLVTSAAWKQQGQQQQQQHGGSSWNRKAVRSRKDGQTQQGQQAAAGAGSSGSSR